MYSYQYIDIKGKWLAAVNSLEPGEYFQMFDAREHDLSRQFVIQTDLILGCIG